jgi:D-alanine-D-alanine ligase
VKVALLMGGRSAERDISLRTGAGIAQALERLGHEAVAIDAANGHRLGPGELKAALTAGGAAPVTEDRSVAAVSARAVSEADAVNEAEVVFLALHGGAGENGTVQGLLELAHKPYTGSNVLASALAMNKAMSKRVFEREGIATPPWLLVSSRERRDVDTTALGGWPLVVKPNEQGSSVALSFVNRPEELGPALDLAFEYGEEVLVERFIPGRELTVAVLGEEALPLVEIRPKGGHYDYESKYTAGRSDYFCPADLPTAVAERIQALGVRAAKSLGCSGVCRVDFRLDPAGEAYCLEVNTIPGMTPTSLVPMAAKARGMSYDQLVQRMLDLALSDWRRRHGREPRDARAST